MIRGIKEILVPQTKKVPELKKKEKAQNISGRRTLDTKRFDNLDLAELIQKTRDGQY